ncbi:MAG: 5'-methylthioadenosine/adenosylhomocysteine nucleosidase [Bacteroides sp.]|nr:5'-methylthioadenosine/adenosylhomocysteine nucleosidase [Bacteroides sp.]
MKRIAVVVAMDKEFALMEGLLQQKKDVSSSDFRIAAGRVGNKEVVLMKSGIGKVAAATGINLIKYGYAPDALVNSGVAGGLGESLEVGDVVAGDFCVYHDVDCGIGNEYGQVQGFPARYAASPELLRAVNHESVKTGLICTGDQFIQDPVQLQAIRQRFPEVLAVDMESAAMAQVCHIWQIPFLSLRVISDTPGKKADNMTRYNDFWTLAPQKNFELVHGILASL